MLYNVVLCYVYTFQYKVCITRDCWNSENSHQCCPIVSTLRGPKIDLLEPTCAYSLSCDVGTQLCVCRRLFDGQCLVCCHTTPCLHSCCVGFYRASAFPMHTRLFSGCVRQQHLCQLRWYGLPCRHHPLHPPVPSRTCSTVSRHRPLGTSVSLDQLEHRLFRILFSEQTNHSYCQTWEIQTWKKVIWRLSTYSGLWVSGTGCKLHIPIRGHASQHSTLIFCDTIFGFANNFQSI